MKRCKRILAALLAALLVALALPGAAMAAGRIDLTRDVGLTVTFADSGVPLVGAAFRLYLVATVDETGELTAAEAFQTEFVDIAGKNDAAWRAQALALEGYALRRQLSPADSGVTDGAGRVAFPTGSGRLTPGLYLLSGSRHGQGGRYYDPVPYLVLLPGRDSVSDQWVYEVELWEKADITPVPDTPVGPATTRLHVVKVWSDAGYESQRPAYVTVYLLRNGQLWDTVRLSAANSWRYTWEELDASFRWTVSEERPALYTSAVAQEGTTVIITNTRTPELPDAPQPPDTPDAPDRPPAPDTPDAPDVPDAPQAPDTPARPTLPRTGQLWWPVPVLLCAGLGLIVLGLVRRRGSET